MYLCASILKVENVDFTECWMMSAEKYVKAAKENVKLNLAKSNYMLPSCCNTPMVTAYHPSEDKTKEINAEGLKVYQELIGILRWAVDIGRVDILLEVSLILSQLDFLCVGHLQVVYRVYGYLKQVPKRKMYFDPSKPILY